ncbi:hypothetical protein [Nocardia sp. NBC_01009]|uniref:hypothetical protein n=1 Tax=Nocardia sp. NBC_01009 TaxID=2975996 RepID=UPI0038659A0F|nr:hypothetical protein OHA42_36735 [Nocardia sp. NBC_01009]
MIALAAVIGIVVATGDRDTVKSSSGTEKTYSADEVVDACVFARPVDVEQVIVSIAAEFDEHEVVTVATEQVRRVMNTLKG